MLQLILFFWLNIFHPFYVSVTEVDYSPKTKTVQVSVRVFFDDFESALDKRYKTSINILKPKDRKQVDGLISDYVKNHLQIKANNKLLTLKYLGYQIEEDAAWCYFESEKVERVQKLNIQNDILFEQHDSQINMIHATVNGKRKSTKLDNPERSVEFSY
ncbi:DUF6702 family protein [Pedobacter foliorum]|uniref:DUF6702 family protein n=1 Tax=Pedobacter foliorum TaxID=2739058 RepID=UPI0015657A84|nr:DUF6702 family protein [Pedobacter foliorum]NRF40513.1 hypothetical protein [Pedobacter foliorum]